MPKYIPTDDDLAEPVMSPTTTPDELHVLRYLSDPARTGPAPRKASMRRARDRGLVTKDLQGLTHSGLQRAAMVRAPGIWFA